MTTWYDSAFVGADEDVAGDIEIVGADEDIGDLELVGDDDVGRSFRRRRPRYDKAVDRYRTARGRTLVERTPTRDRRLVIGVSIPFGPPAGLGSAQIAPQVPFRAERIVANVIGADPLSNYVVEDILVGTRSQLAGGGGTGIPAEALSPTAVGVLLELDAAYLGMLIQVRASKLQPTTFPTELRLTLIGQSLVP